MKKVGIEAASFYVPNLYVKIAELAEARAIPFAKLNKGLGLNRMALCDQNEDAASMAANALFNLIEKNNIDPHKIGRIYLGTESALDAAKPTATYATGMVEEKLSEKYGPRCFKNCDIVDLTFACIGAVDALHNSLDWLRVGQNRQAIVIASDLAKYELNSTGEYTQGAGAVALHLTENPKVLSFGTTVGVGQESVADFFKPRRILSKSEALNLTTQSLKQLISASEKEGLLLSDNPFWGKENTEFELFKEEPVFDGPYSNECYQNRIAEALEHFKSQEDLNVLEDWQHLIFHLPYAFQGRRMILKNWLEWQEEFDNSERLKTEIGEPQEGSYGDWLKKASKSELYQSFISERIAPGEKASSEIGNMYTASIFMSLLSMFSQVATEGREITGDRIGFLSYGSGSKAKVFSAQVEAGWQDQVANLNLFALLENRQAISIAEYEALHRKQLDQALSNTQSFRFSHLSEEELKRGYRNYVYRLGEK
jgi:hydroxymethylglutaryl-CoA synthase